MHYGEYKVAHLVKTVFKQVLSLGGKRMFLEISGTVYAFSFLDDTGLEGGTRVKGLPRSGALHS